MYQLRPMGFNILPPVVKNLLIFNVLVFLAQVTLHNRESLWIEEHFALFDVRSYFFRPHQLITYMFLHADWSHIIFNMFALWMFGSALEVEWGAKRFFLFYMLCGIGAGMLHLGVLYLENSAAFGELDRLNPFTDENRARAIYGQLNGFTRGASGSVFGCLAAYGYKFPNAMMIFPFPMPAKWFVLLYAAGELWMGIRNSAGDNVAHWAHLGGALVGFLLARYWKRQDINRRRLY